MNSHFDLESALRAQARRPAPPAPAWLSARVHARLSAGETVAAPTQPWALRLAPACAVALFLALGGWFFRPTPPEAETAAAALSGISELSHQLTAWPAVLDQAASPYTREWEAMRADAASSGHFLLQLVPGIEGFGKAL